MLISNGKKLIYPVQETFFIMFPNKMMEKYPYCIESKFCGPAHVRGKVGLRLMEP